jgi:hypothetical protein
MQFAAGTTIYSPQLSLHEGLVFVPGDVFMEAFA